MRWTIALEGGPRRVNHAAVAIGNEIFSFGGYCSEENKEQISETMDVHVLNTETYRWWLLPMANVCDKANSESSRQVPCQRYGHTVVEYDGCAYIWGGRNDDSGSHNTLYEFNPMTRLWTYIPTTGQIPPARDGHTAVVYEDKMVIFGGYEDELQRFSQETYILDFNTRHWVELRTTGDIPSWRDFHTATLINGKMYIFGGRSDLNGQVGNDFAFHSSRDVYDDRLSVLDLKEATWVRPKVHGRGPSGRRSHAAWVYNDKLYTFGGFNGTKNKHFNDMFCFDPENLTWKRIEMSYCVPSQRRRHCSVVVGNRMFLFGGTMPLVEYCRLGDSVHLTGRRDARLADLDDMHVLDYSPSLTQFAMEKYLEVYGDNWTKSHVYLPRNVRDEMANQITDNTLSTAIIGRDELHG